jgi:hypothetical protein
MNIMRDRLSTPSVKKKARAHCRGKSVISLSYLLSFKVVAFELRECAKVTIVGAVVYESFNAPTYEYVLVGT